MVFVKMPECKAREEAETAAYLSVCEDLGFECNAADGCFSRKLPSEAIENP